MKGRTYIAAILAGLFCLASYSVSGQVLLNELSVNPGGTDGPCEYFELKGTPGAIVENIHFVSLEGDTNKGQATAVVTFGVPGPAVGANGLIVVVGTLPCGSRTYPAGTTVLQTSLFDTSAGALQNGSNSFLLISSVTPITANTDYDTNDDGVLELPAGATIIDGVAWSDGGAGDVIYGTVLTAEGGTIGAATRFPNNNVANSAAAWYAGAMTGTNDATTYHPTIRSANFPPDGALTPGAPNVGIPATGLSRSFTAYLNGAQEVPANASTARGFGIVTLNEAETSINVSVSYGSAAAPLSSNVTMGHIHGPAAPGVNAGVLFDLNPTLGVAFGSVVNATFAVTPTQVGNLKDGLLYFNIHTTNSPGGEIRGQIQVPRSVLDIDGDGRTDYVVVRPAGGAGSQLTWWNAINGGNPTYTRDWGITGDEILMADFDGDGRDDPAVYRSSNNTFYIIQSSTLTMRIEQFGQAGDNPNVVGDYDGDGRDDIAVYRPGAQGVWYYKTSPTEIFKTVNWGEANDVPLAGDFDGDGKNDFLIRRQEGGAARFFARFADETIDTRLFGLPTDIIVPGDYDGDGITDLAVVRTNASGFYEWVFESSETGQIISDTWGVAASGDIIVQGDYDGDGKTDYAVWRPGAQGTFFIMTPVTRNIFTKEWGQNGDIPAASFNQF